MIADVQRLEREWMITHTGASQRTQLVEYLRYFVVLLRTFSEEGAEEACHSSQQTSLYLQGQPSSLSLLLHHQ